MGRILSNSFVRLNDPFLKNNGAIEQKNDVTDGLQFIGNDCTL
jgi:hypothetical protein